MRSGVGIRNGGASVNMPVGLKDTQEQQCFWKGREGASRRDSGAGAGITFFKRRGDNSRRGGRSEG